MEKNAKITPMQNTANTLTLHNPITINGEKVSVLTYDINEIDGVLFATAETKKKAAAGMRNMAITPAAEFDFALHLYLGFAAIIAVNPTYDFSDLERIKGRDVVEVMGIGRNFMLKSDETSQGSDSDEPTEATPESTTQAKPTSNEKA